MVHRLDKVHRPILIHREEQHPVVLGQVLVESPPEAHFQSMELHRN